MTHNKTGIDASPVRHPTLILRRATEAGDPQAINDLCRTHDGPSKYPIIFRRPAMPGDEVFLAFLPTGELAACIRASIITAPHDARELAGAFVPVQHLPALIIERTCALPGEQAFDPLRIFMLLLADDMVIGSQRVMSQIDTGLQTPSALSTLHDLRYGDLLGRDSNGYPLPALPKARFKHAAKTLREKSEYRFFRLTGSPPFAQYLPDHVKNNM